MRTQPVPGYVGNQHPHPAPGRFHTGEVATHGPERAGPAADVKPAAHLFVSYVGSRRHVRRADAGGQKTDGTHRKHSVDFARMVGLRWVGAEGQGKGGEQVADQPTV